jgi:hypothetical protein
VALPEPSASEEPCWAAFRRARDLAAAGDKHGVTFEACYCSKHDPGTRRGSEYSRVHWFIIMRPDGCCQMFGSLGAEISKVLSDGKWKLPTPNTVITNWLTKVRLATAARPCVFPKLSPHAAPWHSAHADLLTTAAFEQLREHGAVDVNATLYDDSASGVAPPAAAAAQGAMPLALATPAAEAAGDPDKGTEWNEDSPPAADAARAEPGCDAPALSSAAGDTAGGPVPIAKGISADEQVAMLTAAIAADRVALAEERAAHRDAVHALAAAEAAAQQHAEKEREKAAAVVARKTAIAQREKRVEGIRALQEAARAATEARAAAAAREEAENAALQAMLAGR